MEDKIKLLPERVANQIAAGEVVNRPASVVKELMENSIDAGATEVIVNFRNNGRDLIQIVDNGVGMTPNDARMAFERHATSKISDAADIYALHTFGFRGEALASIAAVAQVELRTRHRDAEVGTVSTINGGEFVEQHPEHCDQGAQFKVRNLFYNLRARRSFIEKESSKGVLIREEFRRVALCNPDVALELYGDDTPIYKLTRGSLASRIVEIFGDNIKRRIFDISADTLIVKVSGFIGTPKMRKGLATQQYMFVNGRFFRSAYLHKAVMKGYEKIIPDGLTPSYFLFFEVEPDRVDVNVHPQKTEVKFADDSSIWQILNAAVRETLARTGAVPMMEFDNEAQIDIPIMRQGVSYAEPRITNNDGYNPFEIEEQAQTQVDLSKYDATLADYESGEEIELGNPISGGERVVSSGNSLYSGWQSTEFEEIEIEPTQFTQPTQPTLSAQFTQPTQPTLLSEVEREERVDPRDISVVDGRYCWCRIDSSMVVVDLKRAKERTMYDYYYATLKGGNALSQQILFPIELRVSLEEYELMEEHSIEFSILGFDIEYCERELLKIKGLPADIVTDDVDMLIYELLQILTTTPLDVTDEIRNKMALAMARKSAQGYNKNVSTQEAGEILRQLYRSGHTGHTPSGKRIVWQITKEDVKRQLD
ncbi:MAG: DNA mismatch repair endonuclease MutL [Rikenellaceae bacterium]